MTKLWPAERVLLKGGKERKLHFVWGKKSEIKVL